MGINRKLVVCLIVMLQGTWAFADGCYFPERAVKTIPSIPTQRALLSWRDGTETLIVSSAIDSEAQKLGWIIPLPRTPTEMSKVSPGALKTLSLCLQPRITHDLSRRTRTAAVGFVVALIVLLTWRFKRSRLGDVAMVLFVFFLLSGMFLPALGSAGGQRTITGVTVEKTARVGDYQINVLRARTAAALDEWLGENGYTQLPPAAVPMVEEYVQRG